MPSKLSNEDRTAILDAWKAGISPKELAVKYDVSVQTIYKTITVMNATIEDLIGDTKYAIAEPNKLPGVVCRAIDAGFHDLADEIDKRRNRIEKLEAEIAEFEKDIAALRKWREEHK